jgi:methylthioribose-1-phosphate isomerase
MSVQAIARTPAGAVRIVDQTALPDALVMRDLDTVAQMAEAIRTLRVRGAPLIGIAAAMGVTLALREGETAARVPLDPVRRAASTLGATRPTAVNLPGLTRMVGGPSAGDGLPLGARSGGGARSGTRTAMCRRIGEHGLPLIPRGAQVLTHCNAGALATGGIGTALAPIYVAHEAGRRVHVWASETRPLLQGARLTAWELRHAGIPCTLVTDAAAGALMRAARVDLVLVGADRIAANGDFANKIGTYALAVLALHHSVPFYCVAPSSTIDPATAAGDAITIEHRDGAEVTSFAGRPIAPAGTESWNPAFDVTPARYVTGFLTDRGLVRPPFTGVPS